MNREEIYLRVVEITDRFGADNPQELKLLSSQLSKCDAVEIFEGLLLVFSRSKPEEANYQKQKLAGRMLAKLNPEVQFDIENALRATLPAFNPSIEELPLYFASCGGRDAVIQLLLQLEAEMPSVDAKASARKMRWWLGHRD